MAALAALFALLSAAPALAQGADGPRRSPWERGALQLGVGPGFTWQNGDFQPWLAMSLGAFVTNNIELHADAWGNFPGNGTLWRLSPGARFYIPIAPIARLYVGGFYARYVGTRDVQPLYTDSWGARAGAAVAVTPRISVAGGGVFESFISERCNGRDCNRGYPELQIQFTF